MNNLTNIQIQLLNLLENTNENVVLETIEQLREQGGDFAVIPLMNKFFSSENINIRKSIGKLFSDTKSKKIAPIITNNILKFEKSEYLKDFLNFLWESRIIFEDLSCFSTLLVSNNVQVAIESSSIIDENINNISDANRLKCLKIINLGIKNIKEDFHIQLIELTKQSLQP